MNIAKTSWRQPSVIPGFGITMGFTLFYLVLIVLLPLSTLFFQAAQLSAADFWQLISSPRTVSAFRVSFGCAFAAAIINMVFGVMLAWVLVRYKFPGKKLADALIDVPFALPTAVAGIALTFIYSSSGWVGRWLEPLGINISFTPIGIMVALVFVGLPFVVRTVQPVLEDLDSELEEAAASLGASRWQIFRLVLLPSIMPAALTGFAMAFARALGEYGSVIFIAGNVPLLSEIVPLLIVIKLEQFEISHASAIAAVMLLASFALLLLINLLQKWSGVKGSSR